MLAYQAQQQQEAEEREREEERQDQNRQFAVSVNKFPDILETELADAEKQAGDKLLNTIMEVADEVQKLQLDDWILLSEITPLKAPITYSRMRRILKPHVAVWWENRDKFGHSPVPFLKLIASTILYTDWEAVTIAGHELPKLLELHQGEVQQLQAGIDQQTAIFNQKRQELLVVQQVYAKAKDVQQKASSASLSPPNEAELRQKAENELRAYDYSVWMALAGVFSFVTGPFIVIALPACWYFAIKWAINANKMRKLTPEEFLPHVNEKVRLKAVALAESQRNALEKADTNLATASQNLKIGQKAVKEAKEALDKMELEMATTKAKQTQEQTQKLKGKIDPLMQMILNAP